MSFCKYVVHLFFCGNVLQKQMDTYASECYDSIALFLCMHIIHRYKVLMHKRNAPVLDKSVPQRLHFLVNKIGQL